MKGKKVTLPESVLLKEGGDDDGFSTMDVLDGLNGVVVALTRAALNGEECDQLTFAAKVLSAILQTRHVLAVDDLLDVAGTRRATSPGNSEGPHGDH
jgi:hypothetical protein